MLDSSPKIVGSAVRTRILVALALLERSYTRELARITGSSLMSNQRVCNDLEVEGVLASRISGRQREVQMNPRYYAYSELKQFLLSLGRAMPSLQVEIENLRPRPRRANKPL